MRHYDHYADIGIIAIALHHQRKSELVTIKKALFPRLSFVGWTV
jgi:hypothetical protein